MSWSRWGVFSQKRERARRPAGPSSGGAFAAWAGSKAPAALVLCLLVSINQSLGQTDPFGGGSGDPFGGSEGDPFGGGGDPFGGGGDDPFGGGGDPFGGGGDDPFGGGGDPFGGAGDDPFGNPDDDDPFGGADPVVDGDVPGKVEVIHTTVRFGPGTPEVAVTPTEESGAFLFTVETPVGELPILIQPAGPGVSLTPPPPSEPRSFRPPSIFSAPLPAGSGARALGFAGTFTGIADDATAASWNPAGLIQLKRPEVSAVYRHSYTRNEHSSDSEDFRVGDDSYESDGLNYLTVSLPFRAPGAGNNMVFSVNYQEAYDFASAFTADFRDRDQQRFRRTNEQTFSETQVDRFVFEPGALRSEVEVTSEVTTRSSSALHQVIQSDLEARLEFDQEGIIAALSPALALELHPRFSVGIAVNVYQDDTLGQGNIRSRTRSVFTSRTESRVTIENRRVTSGAFTATEQTVIPGDDFLGGEETVIDSVPTSGSFPAIEEEEAIRRTDVRIVEGEIVEENEFEDLHGVNTTFGLWWVVNDLITIGAAADLPWSADTTQTRRTTTRSTTYDGSRSRVLGASETAEVEERDTSFEFPFFATLGAFFLWTPNLYTAVDIGYANWSDFAYDVEGRGRINPFDGTPHGENEIADTWSVRVGGEYLLQWDRKKIEVPLRCGLVWEQRPAIGDADDYYGFSLGTGIALGEDEGQWLIDVAFNHLRADDIQTLIPDQQGLTTDTRQNQVFVSLIKHF